MSEERMLQLWDELREVARANGAPLAIALFDGEEQVQCFGHEGRVLISSAPPHAEKGFAGHVLVSFDATTLARVLPYLVLELHRALGYGPRTSPTGPRNPSDRLGQ